jgi:predicted RNase H-like nuclease (RuvC/YqgF family)
MSGWKEKTKSFAGDVADKASSAAKEAGEYAKDAGEYLQGKAQEGWEKLDPDTQAAIEEVAEKTVEKKQEISGEKMHQEVTEMIQKQEEYNDLLASKLSEALKRIEKLESKVEESRDSR